MSFPESSVVDVPEVEGVDPDHPMVEIFRLTDQSPVMWHENKIGSTNHPWWFYNVTHVSKWFTAMCISVLLDGRPRPWRRPVDRLAARP